MTTDTTLDLRVEEAEALDAPSDTSDFVGGVLIGVGAGLIIVGIFT
jgi:hypothetical protein